MFIYLFYIVCVYIYRFDYMAISDERQRLMPTFEDRLAGQPLEYKEAVLLTRSDFKGEVNFCIYSFYFILLYN